MPTRACHIFQLETYVIYMSRTRQKGLEQNSGREDRMQSQRRQHNMKLDSIQKEWSGGARASMTADRTTPQSPTKFTNIVPRNAPPGYAQHTHNK